MPRRINAPMALFLAVKQAGIELTEEQIMAATESLAYNNWHLEYRLPAHSHGEWADEDNPVLRTINDFGWDAAEFKGRRKVGLQTSHDLGWDER